ncbi:MAG TPA: DUF6775 family putative metallopeptidase [Nitrosopumilus sp.]|nr:DUF6775 family putative metallopeptidase [Nitrosopumilus sp.]
MKISKVILYNEPSVPIINLKKVQKFVLETFGINSQIKENIFNNLDNDQCIKIASTRIFDLKKPFKKHLPSIDEILIESENEDMSNKKEMTMYDGIELNKIIEELIPIQEHNQKTLHIIFTNKLTCTFDKDDFRYHARIWVGANPIIISTTGIIEAPAKPKQYYLDLMTNFSKRPIEEIKEKYKEELLDYNDIRLSEIIEGCVLQSITYYETGDAFCDNAQCRLFNAHWQKDLLNSQIKNKIICEKHKTILTKMKNNSENEILT